MSLIDVATVATRDATAHWGAEPAPASIRQTSVLIADRRPMNAKGLARVIAGASDLRVHGCCHSSLRLRVAMDVIEPAELVILDPELHDDDPLVGLQMVRTLSADTAVLITTTHVTEQLLLALSYPKVACVCAYSDARGFLSAVRGLVAGAPVLPHQVQAALAARVRHPVRQTPTLTVREKQVFELAAKGLTATRIAQILHISQSTAKAHLRSVYNKLGAPNRSAAIVIAIRNGMIGASAVPEHSPCLDARVPLDPRPDELLAVL